MRFRLTWKVVYYFIGATTENPFEVNPALLSRAQVYVLQALSSQDLQQLIQKELVLPEYASYRLVAAIKPVNG